MKTAKIKKLSYLLLTVLSFNSMEKESKEKKYISKNLYKKFQSEDYITKVKDFNKKSEKIKILNVIFEKDNIEIFNNHKVNSINSLITIKKIEDFNKLNKIQFVAFLSTIHNIKIEYKTFNNHKSNSIIKNQEKNIYSEEEMKYMSNKKYALCNII